MYEFIEKFYDVQTFSLFQQPVHPLITKYGTVLSSLRLKFIFLMSCTINIVKFFCGRTITKHFKLFSSYITVAEIKHSAMISYGGVFCFEFKSNFKFRFSIKYRIEIYYIKICTYICIFIYVIFFCHLFYPFIGPAFAYVSCNIIYFK